MDMASGKFNVWTETSTGKRQYQEDSFRVFSANGRSLFAIADGMGGYGAGDVASSELLRGMLASFEQFESGPGRHLAKDLRITEGLRQAIYRALPESIADGIAAMRATKEAALNPDMGTTLTVAWCWPGEVFWAQVGDSRLYHLAAGTECARLITRDQCWPYPNENVLRRACAANSVVDLTWDADCLEFFGGRQVVANAVVHCRMPPKIS